MYVFKDKVALVTGAAQGIGRSFVQHLLQQNVKVMMLDINEKVGEESRNEFAKKYGEGNVKFMVCDVRNEIQLEDAFKATIKKFGKLDIVLNNAGVAGEREGFWRRTVDINLVGQIQGTYLALKYMAKDEGGNGGTVINTSSITSLMVTVPAPVYAATKAGVNQFTRSIGAKEHYDRTGVRVLAVCPGFTDTELLQNGTETTFPDAAEWLTTIMETRVLQSVDYVGRAMIQMLKNAESGTVWVAENQEPVKRVQLVLEDQL